MRRLLLITALALTPVLAMADENIAGQWQATPGQHVIIAMDVLADGHWTSETVQNNKVVAQMAGTYQQQNASPNSGTLVFTPVKSKTTAEHGQAQVETDKYTLQSGGSVLRLVSSANDVMVFHKQPYAQ